MKVIILAGGYGTRLSEYTKTIPKPMVKIGNKPMISHIIDIYLKYGFDDFIIALGYKGKIIKKYFKKFKKKIKITLADTGLNTMTGGRLKKLKKFFSKNEDFMVTYGDGLANINIKRLVQFHKKHNKLVTITAVRPPARFGALEIKSNIVKNFREKFKKDSGWVNGGFFVMNSKFLKFIQNDKTYLEKQPLKKISRINQLIAYKHSGFWQCMDSRRDKEILDNMIKNKNFLWLK
jgi:glucose-1-phosphate cytidylyltransferase